MASVTGITAARADQIWNDSVINGQVDPTGQLLLKTRGGTTINAGPVNPPSIASNHTHTLDQIVGYSAEIRRTTAQSIPNAVWTKVAFNATSFNRGMTVSNSGITIPITGLYRIDCVVTIDNTAATGQLALRLDGPKGTTRVVGQMGLLATTPTVLSTSNLIVCDANDLLNLSVYQSNGAAKNLKAHVQYVNGITVRYEGPAV